MLLVGAWGRLCLATIPPGLQTTGLVVGSSSFSALGLEAVALATVGSFSLAPALSHWHMESREGWDVGGGTMGSALGSPRVLWASSPGFG